jgi:hypothetical protein
MPTKKPRLLITLEQRPYDVLKVISQTSGKPMSAFVSELLDGAMPTLERMAVTFQKIKQAQDGERARFLETIDAAQTELEPVIMEAIGQFDLFMGKIDDAVEGKARIPEGKPALPDAASATPPTNRGVTPDRTNNLQPSNGKGLKGVLKKQVLKKVAVSNGHKSGSCTCIVTKHERQENKTCPVHAAKGESHAV